MSASVSKSEELEITVDLDEFADSDIIDYCEERGFLPKFNLDELETLATLAVATIKSGNTQANIKIYRDMVELIKGVIL